MDENLKENLKNLSSLLKKYHGQQLITNDEFQAGISDIVNAFAQYRSASQKINKDHEEVLNSVLKQINEEYDRILNELENTKRGANSATTEAISIVEETKKLLSDVYKIKEEILLMKPEDGEDGEDADEEKIIEEVLKRIPPQEPQELPDMEEFENKIEEKFKDVYEQIKRSVKGFPGVRLLASLMDVSITNPTNGQTLVYNSTTSKWENGASGGSSTFYVETPNEAIDGARVDFTVDHTITKVLSVHINGQFIHPSDYSVAGSTITFNTAPDISYAGLSFTVVYV